jgi:putative PIN family toxin of toxin-antitoxin system
MQRVIIDSNILVAAVRSDRGWSHKLISSLGIDPRWQPFVSAPLLQEYAEQIHDPRHTPHWSTAERDDFLDYLCASARWCDIHFLWRPLLPDEDDHLVLEAAVASAAQVIITFNKRDLGAAQTFGIALMTPKEFLLNLPS